MFILLNRSWKHSSMFLYLIVFIVPYSLFLIMCHWDVRLAGRFKWLLKHKKQIYLLICECQVANTAGVTSQLYSQHRRSVWQKQNTYNFQPLLTVWSVRSLLLTLSNVGGRIQAGVNSCCCSQARNWTVSSCFIQQRCTDCEIQTQCLLVLPIQILYPSFYGASRYYMCKIDNFGPRWKYEKNFLL